jgi:hypothetical protein
MDEETSLLVELMLHAEIFCNEVEAAAKKTLSVEEMCELSLKLSQCRGALGELQTKYESEILRIADPAVCADFRNLITSLLWANFLGRQVITLRLYRKLVQIESGFTYLLITRRKGTERNS